ncbi:alpha/beta hydrolase [Pseudochryseolinea flava]|uniref:Alpha/beta hydrolase n=2 Tax=Pseudochryseolinea flava TaxID=2059302 RepID=A0A364Y830_9BACT|nr:alpha/beta hydrolase [Pseudochryseolinea flava]
MQKVTSKDGTAIAFKKSGNGPVVILICGALASHKDHGKLAELLSDHFTVFSYDRRGRGGSEDTKPYAVAREIDDIEALIDHAGGSAFLYGISSGACLALEAAATLGDKVTKLAIYEAPYDEGVGEKERWKAYADTLQEYVASSRNGDAVEYHLKFVGIPDVALVALKASPQWAEMKSLAHTLLYDVAIVGDDRSVPAGRIGKIKVPILVMDGEKSLEKMPFMRTSAEKIGSAIPQSKRRTVEGQDHQVDEKVMAPILTDFFSGGR